MGLTLLAVFTAALLLPGIIATRAYFFAGQTREIEVPVPSLSSANGISLVGGFSVTVHLAYVIALYIVSTIPACTSIPLADPYRVFRDDAAIPTIGLAWSFWSGLFFLCCLAGLIGFGAGRWALSHLDKSQIYGPLADVIESAAGDDKFIVAYVITKMIHDDRFVGYQGTVDSLFRDEDRFPVKVVLKDVVPFYLKVGDDGPDRTEADQWIDWLVLRAEDWHNIAFRVYQFVDDEQN